MCVLPDARLVKVNCIYCVFLYKFFCVSLLEGSSFVCSRVVRPWSSVGALQERLKEAAELPV